MAHFNIDEDKSVEVSLAPLEAKTGDRVLGIGRGSVMILSDDWNEPMSDEESDAFWAGRW